MKKIIYEINCGGKWYRVRRFREVRNGFLEWQIGQGSGLTQPKNWRTREIEQKEKP